MNNRIRRIGLVTVALLTVLYASGPAAAEQGKVIHYKKPLTVAAQRCLAEILEAGDWRFTPQLHEDMMSVTMFARTKLNGRTREHYIYVMNDFSFCGTAGCSMLIGEASPGGICHEIYSDAGSEVAITVLKQRDRGYRRLLTPCEVRFNGREYEKLHDECPNINVQR
jgi:hypothetical protein